jgi:hypothetical protein
MARTPWSPVLRETPVVPVIGASWPWAIIDAHSASCP